jgi:hypothetical protein
MWSSNSTWGSKRIQAELVKVGIGVSDSTVRKYRPKARVHGRDQTWKSFLKNHAKELIAVDFFAVPTATFRALYVFLVLAHERRRVLHFNVTDSPSSAWTVLSPSFPLTHNSSATFLMTQCSTSEFRWSSVPQREKLRAASDHKRPIIRKIRIQVTVSIGKKRNAW